ncbi:Hypothetical protein FKW44_009536 [Caligus rogercresseyi]|uniref:Uncharacterized protein n=1 Tax=Caligus rogercresseyi TaxID=217165 RepID=A0A7T8HFQ5_CALRO|nr:Hypothetical protein FKW44_009536 [Caligus rogercresseyi]
MYRSSGEMPRSNYYPGPGVPPAEAGSNAWYWDGTQYQLQTQAAAAAALPMLGIRRLLQKKSQELHQDLQTSSRSQLR